MIKCKSLAFTYKANQALQFQLSYIPTKTATRFNNLDDLLHLSFTLKISISSEAFICRLVKRLRWSFYCKNSKLLSIFTKSSMIDACLVGSKYAFDLDLI